MFEKSVYGKGRKAEVTIEMALSLALSVVVLFLLLGLFSDNLRAIATNSGLLNLFSRKNEVTKTFNKDDYHSYAPTQQIVQVAADQGVEFYTKWATDTIAAYKDRTDLKESEIQDLAKAITISSVDLGSLQNPELRNKYSISISLGYDGNTVNKTSITYEGKLESFQYDNPEIVNSLSDVYKSIKFAEYKINSKM